MKETIISLERMPELLERMPELLERMPELLERERQDLEVLSKCAGFRQGISWGLSLLINFYSQAARRRQNVLMDLFKLNKQNPGESFEGSFRVR